MEMEKLNIFDKQRNHIGVATRREVHRFGYWHETFHCWFISRNGDLYFQLRSSVKKDYPELLDITAAGHLLATETVLDGIREVEEEIGIKVSFEELVSLGIISYSNTYEGFIDNEFAHVFLLEAEHSFDHFQLQIEEVAGMVKVKLQDFHDLWFGTKERIRAVGFELNKEGEKIILDKMVGKSAFVPHADRFYQETLQAIMYHLNSGGEG